MRSIMRIIIEEPILSLPIPFIEKGILSLAKSFTDNGSRLYLSDEELSKPLFTHRMTVNRAIQNLVKLGYLEKRVESREGGKSYRSLKYLGVEHSNKLHLCLDGDDESIATNCISDSNKLHLCSPSIATNCITHSNKLHHITERNLKDHNLKVTESIVADAPLPTEPELKNPLTDLEPVKEPFQTLEEPETSDLTQPPRDFAPPLPKKKKAPSRKTCFPSPEFWEAATPKLIEWAIDNGADDSAVARWVQEKIIDMGDSAAANGYQFIDWVAAFRKWYRRDLPKGSGPEADIRKATVWLWNHTHGERMEKPPASPVVVTAVRKTLEQLGKTYLTALGQTEEKWRELKLKELRQMIHDNLEAAQ